MGFDLLSFVVLHRSRGILFGLRIFNLVWRGWNYYTFRFGVGNGIVIPFVRVDVDTILLHYIGDNKQKF